MYNAIIPDELLHPTGVYKERLSQSSLYAKMLTVPDKEARSIYDWLLSRGVKFHFGPNEETDLTENQVLQQCKMSQPTSSSSVVDRAATPQLSEWPNSASR